MAAIIIKVTGVAHVGTSTEPCRRPFIFGYPMIFYSTIKGWLLLSLAATVQIIVKASLAKFQSALDNDDLVTIFSMYSESVPKGILFDDSRRSLEILAPPDSTIRPVNCFNRLKTFLGFSTSLAHQDAVAASNQSPVSGSPPTSVCNSPTGETLSLRIKHPRSAACSTMTNPVEERESLASSPAGNLVGSSVANARGISMLAVAMRANKMHVFNELLALGADVNVQDCEGRCLLSLACRFVERIPIVNTLLDAGADPDISDDMGNSPLHVAASLGLFEICRELIRCRADVNLQNDFKATPLHLAVTSHNGENTFKTAEALISGVYNVGTTRDPENMRFRKLSAQRKDRWIKREGQKAALDPCDYTFVTPIYSAAREGRLDLVRLLLDAGASPNPFYVTSNHVGYNSSSMSTGKFLVQFIGKTLPSLFMSL